MLPPQNLIKARIKVVCEELPEYTGYVSRTLNHVYGSQVVTKDLSDALVVAWDSQASSPQVIEMTVSPIFFRVSLGGNSSNLFTNSLD